MSKTEQAVVEHNGQIAQFKEDVLPPDIGERIDEAKRQNKALMALMNELLEEGTDYGREPGIPKPFLHQPGAQQLGLVFKFRPEFEKIDSTIDFSQSPIFVSYEFRCKLHQRDSGKFLGEGVGSCNNYEKKYRYHKDGTTFKDPLDRQNTLLKMAKKRAYVDATLNVTGATRLFTQDQDQVKSYNNSNNNNKDVTPAETVMPFGKHKGEKLKDIPGGYLKWLSKNANGEALQDKAEKVLQQKKESKNDNNNNTKDNENNTAKDSEKKLTQRDKEVKEIVGDDKDMHQDVKDYLSHYEVKSINNLSNTEYKNLIDMLNNFKVEPDNDETEMDDFEKRAEEALNGDDEEIDPEKFDVPF